MGQTKAGLQELTRHHPVKCRGNSCKPRGAGGLSRRKQALDQIGRSAHWRPRMAKSGRAGLSPQCPSTHGRCPAGQNFWCPHITSWKVWRRALPTTSTQRRTLPTAGAGHHPVDDYLWRLFVDRKGIIGIYLGPQRLFATCGRRKSRLGVYAAK